MSPVSSSAHALLGPITVPLAKSGEAVKAGPVGLVVIVLLCVASYFLFRSMSKHLRTVRENFPADTPPGPTPGASTVSDPPAAAEAPTVSDPPAPAEAPTVSDAPTVSGARPETPPSA